MGFFSTILEKLGLKKDKTEEAAAPAAPAAAAPKAEPAKPVAAAPAKPVAATAAARPMKDDRDLVEKPVAPKAISEVDVVSKLEKLASENPAQLNWKVSIVDLLKLLDIDSSGEARKELAEELGCPADQMSDSARMNVWLHKEVLKKIAENGGNIPANLLD
jgi:pyruvate/2-oxoglutarate dehydrogenase complex dihydrolipoamide acyltransferase (E2) component